MTSRLADRLDTIHMAAAEIRRPGWFGLAEADGGTGTVYQAADRFRRQLARLEVAAVGDILDVWDGYRSRLSGQLAAIAGKIDGLDDGAAVPAVLQAAQERAETHLAQVEQVMREYVDRVDTLAFDRMDVAGRAGAADTATLVGMQTSGPAIAAGVGFNRLPDDAVTRLVGAMRTGPLAALLDGLAGDMAGRWRTELAQGIAAGLSPRDVAAGMNRLVDMPRHRTLTIARTETLRAYRETTRASMAANRHIVGGWRWTAANDSRTCAMCWAMHGTLHGPDETMATHPNCFPAGTAVSGPPVKGATARWYTGDLVDIRTRDGRHLAVTPNHPVLTTKGWVPAGEVTEFHDLVCHDLTEGPAAAVYPHDQHGPALIEDVAVTLGGAPTVTTVAMPTAPENFHGDGVGSDVHVVRTHRLLGDSVHASGGEPLGNQRLCRRHTQAAFLAGRRAPNLALPRVDVSAPALVGVGGQRGVLLRGALLGDKTVGRGVAATLDPGVSEGGRDGVAGNPVPSSESILRYAGQVVLDQPVKIRRFPFADHVYNLETSDGWYIANGILAHNCRCAMAPETKTMAELGIPGVEDGPRLNVEPGPDVFARQPQSVQRQVLGPAKFQAWSDGLFRLPDLVGKGAHPQWGPTRFELPLADVLG